MDNKEKFDWKSGIVLLVLFISLAIMIGGIYMGIRNFFIPEGKGFEALVLFSLGLILSLLFVVINLFIDLSERLTKKAKEKPKHSGHINFVTFDENGKQLTNERKPFDSIEDIGKFKEDMMRKHLEDNQMEFEELSPFDELKQMTIQELRMAKKDALSRDDFEWAAIIRDEINSRE